MREGESSLGLSRWLEGYEAKYEWGDTFPAALRAKRQAQADRYSEGGCIEMYSVYAVLCIRCTVMRCIRHS